MIRNETFRDGICIEAEIVDLDAGTFQREEMGVVVESRPLTNEERIKYGPQPLDPAGAIATLNAVLGVWPLADAANAVGLTEQDLINEAQAWAVAGES
jgi:hypothetical protein